MKHNVQSKIHSKNIIVHQCMEYNIEQIYITVICMVVESKHYEVIMLPAGSGSIGIQRYLQGKDSVMWEQKPSKK